MLLRGARGTHHAADPKVNGLRHYSFLSLQEPSTCWYLYLSSYEGQSLQVNVQANTQPGIESGRRAGSPYHTYVIASFSYAHTTMSTSAVARDCSIPKRCVVRMSRAVAPPTNHAAPTCFAALETSRRTATDIAGKGWVASSLIGMLDVLVTNHPSGFDVARVTAPAYTTRERMKLLNTNSAQDPRSFTARERKIEMNVSLPHQPPAQVLTCISTILSKPRSCPAIRRCCSTLAFREKPV